MRCNRPRAWRSTTPPRAGSGDTTPVHIVVNSSGEFACSQPSVTGSASGTQWTCQKLGTADAATENKIFDFYTPAHWVGFLKDFSLAAGLAGDKVSSSTMTVNGFAMNCVDLVAPGVAGTSTICTTAQGILGYVERRLRLRQFRDREVLDVAVAIAVRAATRRHDHDDADATPATTAAS